MKHIFEHDQNWYLLKTDKMDLYKIDDKMQKELEKCTSAELEEYEREANKNDAQFFARIENTEAGEADVCGRLILNITDSCNLACTYCYAEEGSYGLEDTKIYMSLDVLQRSIDRVLEIFPGGIGMIQFFGGEPLVNRKILRESVLWMEEYFPEKGLSIPVLTMVTNGTLITDDDIEFFNHHFDSITISLDGEKDINDRRRIYGNSDASVYDKVKEVVFRMKELDRNFYLALEGTINDDHIEKFTTTGRNETYDDLNLFPVDRIHISPVIDSAREDSLEICRAYSDFFGDWVEKEFARNKHNIRLKNIVNIMEAAKDNIVYGNGCGASQTDLAVTVAGDLYPCFMFIGSEQYRIGNIRDSIDEIEKNHTRIRESIARSEDNANCNNCWLKPMCAKTHGHCIGARYLTSEDIHRPVERFCGIGKRIVETSLAHAEKEWSVES